MPSCGHVHALMCREFNLSSPHPSKSRAAMAARILAERRCNMPFRPQLTKGIFADDDDISCCSEGRWRLREARIARLAQPRTQLWQRCTS